MRTNSWTYRRPLSQTRPSRERFCHESTRHDFRAAKPLTVLRSANSSKPTPIAQIAAMHEDKWRSLQPTLTSWCIMNAKDPKPSQELHSRDELAPVFDALNQYDATTHFLGQSTIFTLSDDRATGEAYCLAHHVTVDGGKRRLMVASLRYLDTFAQSRQANGCFQSACSTWTGLTSAHSGDDSERSAATRPGRRDRNGRGICAS